MRVVVAHNFYRSTNPSGENAVVQAEIELLRGRIDSVEELFTSSDEIPQVKWADKLGTAIGPVLNPAGYAAARRLFEGFRPDVVHVHNVFPLLSPAVLRLARRMGIATVHTVHNFRPDCVNGLLFRDGEICEDCVGHKWSYPAVKHRCYRGSLQQTTAMTVGRRVHRSTWRAVDHYIALTRFHQERLSSLGIPRERVTIRPTSVPDPGPSSRPGRGFLYLGRLDEAKGIRLLLTAWRQVDDGHKLTVAGTGPLAEWVTRSVAELPNVDFVGPVHPTQAAQLIERCAVLIVPSLWFEGFPRVIAEAFSRGRPVACSNHGGPGSIVTPDVGWRFTPRPEALAATVRSISDQGVAQRGRNARARYDQELTPDLAWNSLRTAYAKALGTLAHGAAARRHG